MILKWFLNNEKEMISKASKLVCIAQYVLGRLGGLKAKDAFIDWVHMSGWIIGLIF